MNDESYGGKTVLLTDAEAKAYFATGRDFDVNEVCRFHREKGGVVCDARKRKPGDCYKCGWNPRVSRQRSARRKNEERGYWLYGF